MNSGIIRLALRADASTRIGLGHVKRCLALAAALRELDADVRLVTRELGIDTAAMASAAGIERIALPAVGPSEPPADHVTHAAWAGVGWQVDADQCVEALASWNPHWVVVDHYAFDARWHRRVARALRARTGIIDDLADRDLCAELLVDHNLSEDHRAKYFGRLSDEATVLGGPRFALLGPAYAVAPALKVTDTVHSIGIFMGGVDASNLSSVVLQACRERAGFSGPIEVAITNAYPHAKTLRALATRWPDTAVVSDLPDLSSFFARHDLQIGAGGGAAWERCCTGAPTLALTAAANQDAVLPALAKQGAVALIGAGGMADEADIGAAVRSLLDDPRRRLELSRHARALVDGLGAVRVALWLTASSLSLRPATIEDAEMMYAWRNHLATRSVSLTQGEISWLDHLQWLEASLKATERCLLVGSVGKRAVGVVRFDARPANRLEVSLYLDPSLHGLGLGRALLLAGERHVQSSRAAVGEFTATILPQNTSSMRLFQSCGYGLEEGLWRKNPGPLRVNEANGP